MDGQPDGWSEEYSHEQQGILKAVEDVVFKEGHTLTQSQVNSILPCTPKRIACATAATIAARDNLG
jgi:hypothetical protein